ncbi:MAG: EAL domain-containing protein [Solirubrobacteraceae bacterium]|nr:EAL domain-containing protein [Solirubrobacteraceae bacterium]
MRELWAWLPRGRALPPGAWAVRHRWMEWILAGHIPVLLVWGLLLGYSVAHAVVDIVPISVFLALASWGYLNRRMRELSACVGLLTASAVVVHLMNGAIEAHFHFFVMVALLSLYEEWFPYLVAFGYVLLHHGITSLLDAQSVFNHPDAISNPWKWAAIHAGFIAALGLVCLVSWRLNEISREATAASRERFRSAFADAPIGMALVDLDGRVQQANAVLQERLGLDPTGRLLRDCVETEDLDGRPFPAEGDEMELRYLGGRGWGLWHHSQMCDEDGAPVSWISHCIDVTKRREAERQLSWQAHHDPLTGLPNRLLFQRHLDGALAARRDHTAVLFVDIDDFKIVNDSLGHGAGDRLLGEVGRRLSRMLRDGDVIARFGGDEFTILLPGVTGHDEALGIAQRLEHAMRPPIVLDGERRFISASVGVTIAAPDDDAVDAKALLRDADAAMYRAKELGKARVELFDDSMRDEAVQRLELESALRTVLERDELHLVYQPLVDLETEKLVAVEALLRWEHPTIGMVSPMRFIPLAERNGTIIEIGAWVLREACAQLMAWDGDDLRVSVNVSARQLGVDGYVDSVRAALEETGLAPERLCLEVTETAVLGDPEVLTAALRELKAIGVRLAVDDFGVGHASLRHLRELLPVDTLKIDKSFVDGIAGDHDDAAIVQGVVRLAHSLGLLVVAEGIEHAEQAELLRGWDCQIGQGYHFDRPLPPSAIAERLGASVA